MTIVLSQHIKQITMEQKTTHKLAGAAEKGKGNENGGKPRHVSRRATLLLIRQRGQV